MFMHSYTNCAASAASDEGISSRSCGFISRLARVVVPVAVMALAGTATGDLINDGGFDSGIINTRYWTAGSDAADQWYGMNYSTNNDGYAQLDKAANNWQRRTLMQGLELDSVGTGTFTLSLDTGITDYWKQLNYWKVLAVKDGATLDMSKGGFIWDREMAGSETLFKDYSPEGKDGGEFFSFSGDFTITDDILAEFDYLVIGLVGSRRVGDVLTWDNISLRTAGGSDVPEPASLAMLLLGAGFFGRHARKRRALARETDAAPAV